MPSSRAERALAAAVAHVRAGGLLAYPTETLYGLGADATSAEAVAALRAWKGRGADQPLSILVEAPDALPALGLDVSAAAGSLAARFWPGPLTLVLPAAPGRFAPGVARADGAVGVRCSPRAETAALARALRRAGVGPITATSLNRSGEPPAADGAQAAALCEASPALRLFDPGPAGKGPVSCAPHGSPAPSTVVDCAGDPFRVIREGAISAAALADTLRPGAERPR